MTKKQFEEWITNKLKSFSQFLPDKANPAQTLSYAMQTDRHKAYHMMYIGNFFIHADMYTGETTIFNTHTMKSAKAKCHYEDTFSIYEGIAVAWAKYNNEDVPEYHKTVHRDTLQNGDTIRSTMNMNTVYTFIGWLPTKQNGTRGKWAAVYDTYDKKLLKTMIDEEVIKLN